MGIRKPKANPQDSVHLSIQLQIFEVLSNVFTQRSCIFFLSLLISYFSDSPTVMDTQHIQGEGVPPQAGKGQRRHRPDQRYLSLHPPTVSFCLSQRTTKQEAGRQIDPGRKNPLESGWPTDRLGFQIKGDYLRKYRRVSAETHVPSEPKTPAD